MIVVSYLQKKVHEVFVNYVKLSLPRETDLYKSGDFFLNPIMIVLNCIFVYYYGNGSMDNYGQKKNILDSQAPPHCPQSPHIIDFFYILGDTGFT